MSKKQERRWVMFFFDGHRGDLYPCLPDLPQRMRYATIRFAVLRGATLPAAIAQHREIVRSVRHV